MDDFWDKRVVWCCYSCRCWFIRSARWADVNYAGRYMLKHPTNPLSPGRGLDCTGLPILVREDEVPELYAALRVGGPEAVEAIKVDGWWR